MRPPPFVPPAMSTRLNRVEWVAVAIAVLIAHAFLWHEWLYPSSYDALLYVQLGHEIADKGLFQHFTAADLRTYGYPYLLSLLVRGAARSAWPLLPVVFELQLLFYLAACFFFRSALIRVLPRVALFAFCGMLVNFYVLIYTPETLTESVSLTLLVVAGGCWLYAYGRAAVLLPLLVGSVVAGFAVMVRPANMFIVVAWLIGVLVILLRRRFDVGRALGSGVCMAVALALPMAPQLANNVLNFGKWTPLVVLDLGQMQQTWGVWNIKYATAMPPVSQGAIYYENPLLAGTKVEEQAPWRWYLDHPGRGVLTLALHTFNLTDQDLLFTYSRDLDPWYRVPLGIVNHAIVALGLLGLFLGVRRVVAQGTPEQRDAMLVLLVMTGANWAVYSWTAVEMRFGSVLLLLLFPFAGYALARLAAERGPGMRAVAGVGVALYVALALALSSWVREQAPLIRDAVAKHQSR
jgi:hypothetical protein